MNQTHEHVRITPALMGATLVGALGGLLFGFDTAVISGCQDQLKELMELTAGEQGFMTASALIGAAIGSLAAAKPGDLFGRRDCLKWTAAFYLLCALGCAFATELWMIVAARILGGIAVGASSVLGPMYLAEIAPASWRGRLVACFQVNIVLGVLIAYFSNYLIGGMGLGDHEWRWKLGVQALPAAAFLITLFFIPRSPRWLAMKGLDAEARETLGKLGVSGIEQQLASIKRSLDSGRSAGGSVPLFSKAFRRPVFLAIAIALFNQLGGINALWYYADTIFAMAGFSKESSALQAVGLGAANIIATLFGMAIIDKVGRKPLLMWGTAGCGLALAGVAWIFTSGASPGLLVWLFGLFVICHAFGQGAVIWVFISEIFPTAVRSKGQTLGSFTHWFMAMIVSWAFPLVAKDVGAPFAGLPFGIFAAMMVLQLFVVGMLFPETKQIALEDIDERIHGSH
ncbi:sugar porter family MFS transporter [Luteolibacter sp. GHJ8]|uniref:Sugar porter family MFS transporter n=1 Tax=Luteolibacter rhizosphaerae TaxID=2989719 RepID=A0ABT3G6V9_9BACT|nr:sugar porter family MFS transporter [Luteolibacter rhizosphaerae]MCW1915581.1 sugar porter family MFS transporter [Luteolibacter rhizosphaerae]